MSGESESIKSMILSTGRAEILQSGNEYFLVRWSLEERNNLLLMIFVKNKFSDKTAAVFQVLHNAGYSNAVLCEKAQNLKKRYPEELIQPVDEQQKMRVIQKYNAEILHEGKDFLLVSEHHKAEIRYTIEAVPNGRSGMANNTPWSTDITPEQAWIFSADPEKLREYYTNVRYGKKNTFFMGK